MTTFTNRFVESSKRVMTEKAPIWHNIGCILFAISMLLIDMVVLFAMVVLEGKYSFTSADYIYLIMRGEGILNLTLLFFGAYSLLDSVNDWVKSKMFHPIFWDEGGLK